MKWHLVYFVQGFMHPLWWLQSPEIITCNSVLVPLAHAIISMLVLAPMFILLQARPFICKQNKCIQFRQHHILMNIRIITKKRKYLVIDRGGGVPSFDEMMDIALVEVDFDDPTMNVRGRRALAIAKPTPRGY